MPGSFLRAASTRQLTLLIGSFAVTLAILTGATHLAGASPGAGASPSATPHPTRVSAAETPRPSALTLTPTPSSSRRPFALHLSSPLPQPTPPPLVIERRAGGPGMPDMVVLAGSSYASRRFQQGGTIAATGEALAIDGRGPSGTLRVTWELPAEALPPGAGTKLEVEICVTVWGHGWQLVTAGGAVSPASGEGLDSEWWNRYMAATSAAAGAGRAKGSGISDCWTLRPIPSADLQVSAVVDPGTAMTVHEIRYRPVSEGAVTPTP